MSNEDNRGRGSYPNPVVQETARIAYDLRRQGKQWPQIAKDTGFLTRYDNGNYSIQYRAKRYAARHRLPWPPVPQGEHL